MVNYCIVYGCKNKAMKDSLFSFYKFSHPNSELLAKWMQAMRRKDWQPTKNSFPCSEYFEPSCFVIWPGKICYRLNPGVIPSIFPAFPEHLQKSTTKRKSPTKGKQLAAGLQAQASPSKLLKRIETDHTYAASEQSTSDKVQKLKRQLRALREKVWRRTIRINNMKNLLKSMQEKDLIAKNEQKYLHRNFGGITQEIFENELRRLYTRETKQFAMTLHYYSPKAYEFVCKIFALPHSSGVRTWAASVDREPGYLMNVIQLLGKAIQERKWMSDAILVVDGMKLHSEAVWDPKVQMFVGNIDYRTAIPELVDGEATEALVFMVVGMTGNWKHPIAYVIQDKCTTAVQA